MDNIKSRYDFNIKHPVTTKTYNTVQGHTISVKTIPTKPVTFAELDAQYDAELEEQGWNVAALKRDHIDFDEWDPDDPRLDKYKKPSNLWLA